MAISTSIVLKFAGAAVQRGLASIRKGFSSLASAGKSALSSLFSPLAKLAALLGPAALTAGIVKLTRDASGAAAGFENMKSQFELFTGSVAESQKLIGDLRKIAIDSPLELSDISGGARMLLTYGVAADEVADSVSRLSEVSAGDAERFGRISYAFGQISSLGRLMGTELRQLTEAGFNPLENISKRTGETMRQLKGRMEEGGIAIDEVKLALKDATSEGGRFFGLNAKMAQTFSGRVSMMRDQWGRLLVDLGTGLNNGLKVAVDAMTANMPALSDSFKLAGGLIGPAISDAVSGDMARFVAIGEIIGDAMMVGMKTAFQSLGKHVIVAMDDMKDALISPMGKARNKWSTIAEYDQRNPGTATASDLLQHNIDQSGIAAKFAAMKNSAVIRSEENPGFRMANGGERSIFNDAAGRKIIQFLEGVAPNTGGKFRYARDGERSTFTDATGNRLIQILTNIDRSLSPQP